MGHSCLFKARATSSSTYFIAALLVRDSEPTGSGILIRCSCKGAARWYLGGDFSLSPSFFLSSSVLFPFSLVSSSPSFYFVLPSIRTRTFLPLRSLSPVFLTAIRVALENRARVRFSARMISCMCFSRWCAIIDRTACFLQFISWLKFICRYMSPLDGTFLSKIKSAVLYAQCRRLPISR